MSEVQQDGRRESAELGRLSESPWAVSMTGLRTVYGLELRQRVRSRWWAITILIWFAVLAALTTLIYLSVADRDSGQTRGPQAGTTMFSVVSVLVLSLAALISPALSATSINGDRSHGVLAALQGTLLTPAELVLGKLLAAWTSALTLIAAAVPFFAWAYLLGGTTGRRLITTLVLIGVSLLVVCAIGLGCSALMARTSASAAQTYLLVTSLGLGLPLLFAISLPLVQQETTRSRPEIVYLGQDANGVEMNRCELRISTRAEIHTEYTWWLLAASPYVVIADASPAKRGLESTDILSNIRSGVRSARLGPAADARDCTELTEITRFGQPSRQLQENNLPAAWPYGLGIDLLLGSVFTVGAIRRLRIPAKRLPRGTRVA